MSKINKAIAALSVVASLGVAAAPLATFATEATFDSDSHQDTLDITVLPSCTFGSVNLGQGNDDLGVAHTAGSSVTATDGGTAPSWDHSGGTGSTGTGRTPDQANGVNANGAADLAGTEGHTTDTGYEDTITYSMYAGTSRNDLGTTTLKVFCNNNEGYTIKAAMQDLTETTQGVQTAAVIDTDASYSASETGYALYRVAAEASDGMSVDQGESAPYANDNVATKIAHRNAVSKATGDTLTITYGIGIAPAQKAANYEGSVVYTLIQGVTTAGN